MGDVMDSVLSIDARLAHTLVPLYFKPGLLTIDYFACRRARYVTPFRLVFFLAIVAFLAIQLSLHTVSSGFVLYQTSFVASTSAVEDSAQHDSHFDNGNVTLNGRVIWNRKTMPWLVGGLPDFVNCWLNDFTENARSNLHGLNSGNAVYEKTINQHLIGSLIAVAPQVLFVMLPIFSLMLKVFYLSKRRMYMEHLVVAMHSHAFIMLSLFFAVMIDILRSALMHHAPLIASLLGSLQVCVWIWLLAYLLIMQKRIYREGWLRTTLKFAVSGISYTIMISVGGALALLASLGRA